MSLVSTYFKIVKIEDIKSSKLSSKSLISLTTINGLKLDCLFELNNAIPFTSSSSIHLSSYLNLSSNGPGSV